MTDTTATGVAERSRDVHMEGTDGRVGDQGHNGGAGGRAYSKHMGIADTEQWLACNECDEVQVIAMEINGWYADGEGYEDMDEEDVQEAQRLLAWAQTITTATR